MCRMVDIDKQLTNSHRQQNTNTMMIQIHAHQFICSNVLIDFCFVRRVFAPLPGLTPEGYRLVLCKLSDFDASKYNYNDSIKL